MIRSFGDLGTEDIFHGHITKRARATCPEEIWSIARRKLDQIHAAGRLQDLAVPPGNRLEKLKADRVGQWSIRVNDRFRVCFRWEEGAAEDVEIVDYH